ncbi:hypothetical protein ACSBR1_028014 [Camellia fascicularis]
MCNYQYVYTQGVELFFFFIRKLWPPPKRLEVSRSSNGEDDEEWSLISEMHSRYR